MEAAKNTSPADVVGRLVHESQQMREVHALIDRLLRERSLEGEWTVRLELHTRPGAAAPAVVSPTQSVVAAAPASRPAAVVAPARPAAVAVPSRVGQPVATSVRPVAAVAAPAAGGVRAPHAVARPAHAVAKPRTVAASATGAPKKPLARAKPAKAHGEDQSSTGASATERVGTLKDA